MEDTQMQVIKALLAVSISLVVGCDGGDVLDNTLWAGASGSIGLTLRFADGRYVDDRTAIVETTGIESRAVVQSEKGQYKIDGAHIAFTPDESTCPADEAPHTDNIEIREG